MNFVFKTNYAVIIGATILVAVLGSAVTETGMSWYDNLIQPALTPPDVAFGIAWTIIYILTALSAILFWNKSFPRDIRFWFTVWLFVFNGVLNVLWSFLFFGEHLPGLALICLIGLWLTLVSLVYFIWPTVRLSAYLLLPYLLWVTFAGYLNYSIWILN